MCAFRDILARDAGAGAIVFGASCGVGGARACRELRSGPIGSPRGGLGPDGIAALGERGFADPDRNGHTATLVGTGDVFLAGGGSTPSSTEILLPYAGRVVPGPPLVAARTRHTATVLFSGKVLLAGGSEQATAELYDPVARTVEATGPMGQVRRGHLAVRLRSGKVLVVGGVADGDLTNELFDPTTKTWSSVPNRRSPKPQALATLASGKVLVVSAEPPTTELFDPEVLGASDPWTTVASALPRGDLGRTATRVASGRVVVGHTVGCAGVLGGAAVCDSRTAVFNPTGLGSSATGPVFGASRNGFTAVRLVNDDVAFVGGDLTDVTEIFTPPLPTSLTSDGSLVTKHVEPTATLLPGGDVVVVGGTQAAIDRRIAIGTWSSPPGLALSKPRERHASVRLHDGDVLVTGGTAIGPLLPGQEPNGKEAEIVRPAVPSVGVVASMNEAREYHAMTTLRSGKVLVTGGKTSSAELFDPGPPARWTALPPMSAVRERHTSTLLPSGKVLLVGGDADGTAELFDEATATFSPLPKPLAKRSGHGAVLLPNGLVLVVGGATAELFDPKAQTFRATTAPGSAREGQTARLLASGKVFVAGGSTLAAELYDPTTETWSFTVPQTQQFPRTLWSALPDGRLVASGGQGPESGRDVTIVFDPLASSTGAFTRLNGSSGVVADQAMTLAGTGEVIVTGGQPCYGGCFGTPGIAVLVYRDGATQASRPTIASVPSTVVAGSRVTVTGSGFANASEASDGTTSSSPANHPLALWVSDAGDAVLPGTVTDFTDTTATWIPPPTALYGHGQLFLSVAGVMSRGASVTITPALAATSCQYDVECQTGFCVDGVCCDRRCDGVCEGCSKRRKTNGEDGVCGAVPPGRDITGRCVLKLGDACTAKEECGPNFCAQGVCCDSACEGQCLACNLSGKAGRCSAINEGACGAACDGDHTLKQIGAPDVDCAPYRCGGPRCNTTCSSVRDCVAPAVCSLAGECVPARSPLPGDDVVCGCKVVGASRLPSIWSFGSLSVLGFVARARRRRRPEVSR